jgi:hypothetical protein
MNRPRDISPRRVLTYIAMLAGAMVTTMLVPAYGQQEVAPDWYDPYAVTVPSPAPSAAVAISARPAIYSAQPAVAFHRHEAAVKSVALTGISGKSRGKQPATQSQTADISLPKDRNQQEKVAAITR